MSKTNNRPPDARIIDVVVVGAGQAGLAAGYYLKQAGADFVILDRERRIGQMWRNRYDSLVLITPRQLDGLPGLAMAGDPTGRPAAKEFADYLETYAKNFDLPVRFGMRVDKLSRSKDGLFELTIPNHLPLRARKVVLAFGAYPGAALPPIRKDFSPKVSQFHPYNYGNPKNVPPGPVLIVGDGATGREIAAELAPTHNVFLASGRPRVFLPEHIFGQSMWWWLEKLGFTKFRTIDQAQKHIDILPTSVPENDALKKMGVETKPRLLSAKDTTASFSDGTNLSVRSVIWTMGHLLDTRWIDISGSKDSAGHLLMDRGVSPIDGLFFVGRPWQSGRNSGLIMGVGRDAKYVVSKINLLPGQVQHIGRQANIQPLAS